MAIVAAARTAEPAAPGGSRLAGASNIFGKEIREWYRTRRFAVTAILTSLLFGAVPVVGWIYASGLKYGKRITFVDHRYESMIDAWMVLAVTLGAYLLVALTMGIFTKEEEAGTAQWVLTKPVSRNGYVLAKWAANTLGAIVASILIPSLVFWLLMLATTTNGIEHPGGVLAALAIAALHAGSVIALIVGLSAFFRSNGVIAGVAIGVNFLALAFGGLLGDLSPWLPNIFPVYSGQLASRAASGSNLYPWEPLFVAAAIIPLALALACWRLSDKQLQ